MLSQGQAGADSCGGGGPPPLIALRTNFDALACFHASLVPRARARDTPIFIKPIKLKKFPLVPLFYFVPFLQYLIWGVSALPYREEIICSMVFLPFF